MTPSSRRRRTRAGIVAVGLIAVLGLTACGASATDSSAPAPGSVAEEGSKGDNAGGGTDNGSVDTPQNPADPRPAPALGVVQRSLVYTGSINVRADDVVTAANRAVDIVTGSGGVVGGDQRTLDEDRSEAQLILRVPAEKFAAIMDQLARLGTEESRAIRTEDVTADLIDLDARVAAQQASVDRVRSLLARAQTIAEIVAIEAELTRRAADLDSLKQRREQLAGLAALSTITLNLRGPAAPAPIESERTGFLAGLRDGWAAFLDSAKVMLTVLGWLLPWMLAIGIPVWLISWLLRHRRPARLTPTTHAAAGLGAIPAPPAGPAAVPAPVAGSTSTIPGQPRSGD